MNHCCSVVVDMIGQFYMINNGVIVFTWPECAVAKVLFAIEFSLN
jgi:hypothetical protein